MGKNREGFPSRERERGGEGERSKDELTYLLGHSVEEVAVSALLLPCPHEAWLLSTRRSGAELHGALACSLSTAANDANVTRTTCFPAAAAAAAGDAAVAVAATGGVGANGASGSVSLGWW